jgi:AraC-like DNA-binding protein
MAPPSGFSPPARIYFDLGRFGLPSVPRLGRYNYTRANPPLQDHRHEDAVEICLLARGRQTYSVGGQRFDLQGGEVFLTYPNEVHGTAGAPEEKGLLYWLTVLDPRRTRGSLLGLPTTESRLLWAALIQPLRRHFSGTSTMRMNLEAVLNSLHAPDPPLGKVTRANHLVGFLLEVIAARGRDEGRIPEPRFTKVLAHIAANLGDPESLTLGTLAQLAGLSVSRFKVSFKAEFGVPPAEYALRARIAEAQRRLAEPGATVTDVALDLGFSSSQYFASSFKRITHSRPSQFKRHAVRAEG